MHPAFAAGGHFDADRRMHHHHEDDAEALGVIDPGDALPRGCVIVGHGVRQIGSYLSHIRSRVLHSPLPIQIQCQGGH
jgi:hypothetical protein